ncbi:MAG: hypothetical protein LiPW39_12 [Parcubacteria group bacterium LiPW_39]|nr:MAG: hypothetical protein LiPW39_12 [Parcubacteria group bacterium LiPW_39]
MEKWQEETKEVLAAFTGICGGTLLSSGLLNTEPAKALVGTAMILVAIGLLVLPRLFGKTS